MIVHIRNLRNFGFEEPVSDENDPFDPGLDLDMFITRITQEFVSLGLPRPDFVLDAGKNRMMSAVVLRIEGAIADAKVDQLFERLGDEDGVRGMLRDQWSLAIFHGGKKKCFDALMRKRRQEHVLLEVRRRVLAMQSVR